MTAASPPRDPIALAAGFSAATEADWRQLVAETLKGADFEKRLVSTTLDGIRIDPLYQRRRHGAPGLRRSAGSPWRIAQRVDHPDPGVAAELARADLDGGADMLTLVMPAAHCARGFGLAVDTVGDLDAALAGVALDMIALRLEPAPAGRIIAAMVTALASRRGHDPQALDIDFGLDPVAALVRTGTMAAPWDEIARRVADTATTLAARGFKGPFLTADMRPVSEAGASEAEELATGLATAVAYLRALEAGGMVLTDAARAISFVMPVDADQLLGIAKLRALRRLWARVLEAAGIAPEPATIHAETAWRMMTRRDPWVNMLRTTLATFSAGVGGADTLTVLPYTSAIGLADGFARRIARNTQNVLIEESNLWRIADAAAGSGAYEALTDELCKAAWSLFQDIERAGGIVAAVEAGDLARRIASTRDRRKADIARRKLQITGTSEFPLLVDQPVKVLDVAPDPARGVPALRLGRPEAPFADTVAALIRGAGRAEVMAPAAAATTSPVFVSERLAEPFEALRDAADRHKAATGAVPRVFLAALGPLADHSARSTWIRNALAVGGIDSVTEGEGFTASGDVGAAFAQSGATIGVITGTDATYAELAEATAAALKSAGAAHVYLAGRPGAAAATLEAAGVDGFIAAGQDLLALLASLHEALDVGR